MHLSSVSCLIGMHLSFAPCLMYFLSHVFRISFIPRFMYSPSHFFCVSSLLRLMLFDTLSVSFLGSDCVSTLRLCVNIRIASQITSQLQTTSRNQLYVTKIEIGDSWRNKMYMERADILYSVELSNQLHSTYSLMGFSLSLLTLRDCGR